MPRIKINRHSSSPTEGANTTVAFLAQDVARLKLAPLADLTDSSTGANIATKLLTAPATLINAANASTNLADKTTAEAAMTTVLNGIRELAAQTNTFSANLGLPAFTYNGGGAAPDLTIAAVTKTVTAAVTGVPAATVNTVLAAYANALYQTALRINALCKASGTPLLGLTAYKNVALSNTVAALPTSLGTAADPGVTKVAFDAELTKLANNIATIASTLNAISTNAPVSILVI